jgi:hypothetical protein
MVTRRRAERRRPDRPGLGIDAAGGPVIDPSENVAALVVAESKRHDDLRLAAKELSDTKHSHQRDISSLRAAHQGQISEIREIHQKDLAKAESGRLDSIRQVDREEVVKTAVAANTAIQTLAKQTTELQQTLAKQVTDTAAAQETRSSAQYNDTNKRLSAVELALSEGKGKQQMADPAMDRMAAMVEKLVTSQAEGTGRKQVTDPAIERMALTVEKLASLQDKGAGRSEGLSDTWKMVIAAIGLLTALNALGLFDSLKNAPSPPYVPAPYGTQLPVTPVTPRQ